MSFLPLDKIWADERFDPTNEIVFDGEIGSYNAVEEGDVLLPKVAPTFAQGRVAIARGLIGGRALATSEVFVLRCVDPDDARFLSYRLRAADFIGEGVSSWTGVAGLKRVSADFVRNTPLEFDAGTRRGVISDFLDRECARIAELSTSLATLLDKLLEPALSTFASLTVNASSTQVGQHYDVQLGKMLDAGKTTVGEAVPYLRNSNVRWDHFDLSDLRYMTLTAAERRRYEVRPGDLLACEGRHVGKSAIWDGAITPIFYQKALHRVRPRVAASNRFLMWCLWLGNTRGDYYADNNGSTIPHLPAEKLRRVRIPDFDRESQDRITNLLPVPWVGSPVREGRAEAAEAEHREGDHGLL